MYMFVTVENRTVTLFMELWHTAEEVLLQFHNKSRKLGVRVNTDEAREKERLILAWHRFAACRR
jgi:hypothetical protein